jgi:hypothetical protein
MTPQEQELVNELFHRLAQLESNPRDPSAERLIADGLREAPHAIYALVQTALVQDEALKRANARIEELQAQTADESRQHGGFLDSVRDELFGKRDLRGSVPSVRAPAQSSSTTAPPYRPGPGLAPGGSFLGTAASTAAGVIGGGLLLNSIRSVFGDHAGLGGQERNARGRASGSAADSYLAQQDRDQDQDQDQDDEAQAQDAQDQDQDQDQDDDGGDFGGDDTDA